ncbi:VP22 [Psittacid alphaherpesvirus 1]|uniref:Tegument protein VP22 n=1 Tax=Psittacid herpesvirus 1 (isolate Amazon parrot/-/97-0001/1997) TaxID=670426 RepID=VP22_PSHV1|nr:tegument protein VP22 [Psittacid alphaherpesvirus 1]Q6UDL8.1 RecName: Full=Tegument protein VP22 [Psittacid herpesvirus 1 Amazon parrot/1997]AAQ73692.1 VP22 [Psittacid alphaherpesvirus 1]
MSYYTNEQSGGEKKTRKSSSSKRSDRKDSASSSPPPPGAVRGRVMYPPGYDGDAWLSRRERRESSGSSDSSSSSRDDDDRRQPEQQPKAQSTRERRKSQTTVTTRRKTDRGDGGKSSNSNGPWSIDNQCANLVKRLSLAKGFGPSATPASDSDRWRTTTNPANRSAFVQAVSVTAMAQGELAARAAWEKYKPRNNEDLEKLVETLEIKITVNPGRGLWDVASNIASAIRNGQPITHDLLYASSPAGDGARTSRRQSCRSKSMPRGDEEDERDAGSPRPPSSRRR